jgi:ankyrin repeat protein
LDAAYGRMLASALMADALIEAIRGGKLAAVRTAVKANPDAARHPKYIVAAGQSGSLGIIELLHRNGSDLNASYKKYTALSNLIQTNPHTPAEGKADPERLACLTWILDNGADTEQLSAWPPARAMIVAAFVGQPEYVKALRKSGARMDGFAAAAFGDAKLVEKRLRADPNFARARDHGALTALQCAAGSRLPGAKVIDVAAMLLRAGAEAGGETQSWGHPVDAVYLVASAKNLPMFDLFLKSGADATKALTPALWNATLDFAALALEYGGDADRAVCERKPLLNHLICWGRIPQTMRLMAHNASPNLTDVENGWTAVHQAASRGNARIMRAVLDAGGDLGRRDKQGRTPTDIARLAGRDTLVALMAAGR